MPVGPPALARALLPWPGRRADGRLHGVHDLGDAGCPPLPRKPARPPRRSRRRARRPGAVRHPRGQPGLRDRAAAAHGRGDPAVGLRCVVAPARTGAGPGRLGRRWTPPSPRPRRSGPRDIQWVHGSPPQWAALDPEAPGIYGPGTSSAPDQEAYLSFLRQVAERYKGRITSYQVWNEANIKIFYRGKPDYLAELTLRAKEVLDEVDPDALLVGASTTVRVRRAGQALVRQVLGGPGRARVAGRRDGRAPLPAGRPGRGHARGLPAAHARLAGRARLDRPALGHRDQLRRPPRLRQGEGDRPAGGAAGWVARTYIDSPRPRASTACTGTRGTTTSSASTRWTPQTGEILPAGPGLPDGAGVVRRRVLAGLHRRAHGADRRGGGADDLRAGHRDGLPRPDPVQPRRGQRPSRCPRGRRRSAGSTGPASPRPGDSLPVDGHTRSWSALVS